MAFKRKFRKKRPKKRVSRKTVKKVVNRQIAKKTEYKYRISPQQARASNPADPDDPAQIALLGAERQPTEDSGLLYQAVIDAGDPTASPPTHILKVDRSQGTHETGPLNSYIVIPRAYNKFFYQGNGNGGIIGNQICPKNITMKMTIDFEGLRRQISMVGAGSIGSKDSFRIQSYRIWVRQGWITRNSRSELLSSSDLNLESGQQLPAMPLYNDGGTASHQTTEVHKYNMDMLMAKEVLYEQAIQAPWLSFEGPGKKSQYIELRKFEVKPVLNQRWTANSQPITQSYADVSRDAGASAETETELVDSELRQQKVVGVNVTRPQNFKFNWSFPKNFKQQLYPIVAEGTGDPDTGVLQSSNVRAAFGWTPIVMVSIERERDENMTGGAEDHIPNDDYRSYIQCKTVSKFTYTDA